MVGPLSITIIIAVLSSDNVRLQMDQFLEYDL